MTPRFKGIGSALAAAALFGASTPLSKLFLGEASPFLIAGLLYLGSGLGLGAFFLFRLTVKSGHAAQPGLNRKDRLWFLGAVVFGGILAPVLLMLGLSRTEASSAALLLNMEAVATAWIAWMVFKENVDKKVFLGFLLILLGAIALSFSAGSGWSFTWSALLIPGACLCWGIDNNLTRKVADCDPVLIACLKGLMAGTVNTFLALVAGAAWPSAKILAAVGMIGFLGYGLSLVLFILGLRYLGAARTGAYFSTAPFAGAVLAVLLWPESFNWVLLLAAVFMGLGVWLHLTEFHEHTHIHEPMEHEHLHVHDEHHQHIHQAGDPATEPHVHFHRHSRISHSHRHDPDSHHQHSH